MKTINVVELSMMPDSSNTLETLEKSHASSSLVNYQHGGSKFGLYLAPKMLEQSSFTTINNNHANSNSRAVSLKPIKKPKTVIRGSGYALSKVYDQNESLYSYN